MITAILIAVFVFYVNMNINEKDFKSRNFNIILFV